jgi:ATP-dependent DNA helicase DinG
MSQVHSILQRRGLPFPLFRLERGGVHAIERFKRSGNGILLASGALWEGIDIPGDTLSMLIIVKLPFSVPDPIGDYEQSLCGSMDIYKARCVVPDMLVKLKQGFGRLIRTETDSGVVAILDSRVNGRGAYRSRVLAALPTCGVTHSVVEVKDFIRDIKSIEYFGEGF